MVPLGVSLRGHIITLGDIAGTITMLEIACRRCERRDSLRVDRLIEGDGAPAAVGATGPGVAHAASRGLRPGMGSAAGRLMASAPGAAFASAGRRRSVW